MHGTVSSLAMTAATLAISPGASVHGDRPTVFEGPTSERAPVVATVTGRRLSLRLVRMLGCTAQAPFVDGTGVSKLRVRADGRFRSTQRFKEALDDGVIATGKTELRGRVRGNRITGKLWETVDLFDPSTASTVPCRSDVVRFTAMSGTRRYGADTPRGPVAVTLSRDGRVVKDMLFVWSADCTNGDTIGLFDELVGFPIRGDGTFGDRFEDTSKAGDGTAVSDYRVHGTVRRRAVKAVVSVTYTLKDASGATTTTCDAGDIPFTARR